MGAFQDVSGIVGVDPAETKSETKNDKDRGEVPHATFLSPAAEQGGEYALRGAHCTQANKHASKQASNQSINRSTNEAIKISQ